MGLFQGFSWVHRPRNKIVYYIQFYPHCLLVHLGMAALSSSPPAMNTVPYIATSPPNLLLSKFLCTWSDSSLLSPLLFLKFLHLSISSYTCFCVSSNLNCLVISLPFLLWRSYRSPTGFRSTFYTVGGIPSLGLDINKYFFPFCFVSLDHGLLYWAEIFNFDIKKSSSWNSFKKSLPTTGHKDSPTLFSINFIILPFMFGPLSTWNPSLFMVWC